MHLQGFLKIHLPKVAKTSRMDIKAENPTFGISRIVNVKLPRNASCMSDLKRTLEDKNTMHDFFVNGDSKMHVLVSFSLVQITEEVEQFFL